MSVSLVTEQTFEKEVLSSELPVLVDLYADWCAPCKQLSPIVAEVARELAGKLKVIKVDVDKSPRIAQSFRVQSIPMLALIHQGQIVDTVQGLIDKKALLAFVKPVLPGEANALGPKELDALLRAKRAVPVDIRDPSAFGRCRIPRAINVPLETLTEHAATLSPVDGRVRVLYSRTTEEARTAAQKLLTQGVQVGFLEGGFLHWEVDGLDTERPD